MYKDIFGNMRYKIALHLHTNVSDGRLFVSRGLGNPHVIPRINNDPEIVCIQI